MGLHPTTERELIIQMDGKLTRACEAIERCAESIEKLEVQKINAHETRILVIEKWMSEWRGAYKIMSILGLVLGIISTMLGIFIIVKKM